MPCRPAGRLDGSRSACSTSTPVQAGSLTSSRNAVRRFGILRRQHLGRFDEVLQPLRQPRVGDALDAGAGVGGQRKSGAPDHAFGLATRSCTAAAILEQHHVAVGRGRYAHAHLRLHGQPAMPTVLSKSAPPSDRWSALTATRNSWLVCKASCKIASGSGNRTARPGRRRPWSGPGHDGRRPGPAPGWTRWRQRPAAWCGMRRPPPLRRRPVRAPAAGGRARLPGGAGAAGMTALRVAATMLLSKSTAGRR